MGVYAGGASHTHFPQAGESLSCWLAPKAIPP